MSTSKHGSKSFLGSLMDRLLRPFKKETAKEAELRARIKKLTADRDRFRDKAAKFRSQRDDLRGQFNHLKSQFGILADSPNLDHAYALWIAQYDTLGDDDRQAIRRHIGLFPRQPLISVIMPVWNVEETYLRRAVDSVRNQLYPHWELCIADDFSNKPHVRAVLEEYAGLDERIRVIFRDTCGHISAASNSAISLATGEYLAFLDHDDELREHALYLAAHEILTHPEADLIFSDEDKIDEAGNRFAPYFKPDFNYDLLTSQNCICHLGVYRTELIRKIGGFRPETDGAQDWDLAFRVIEHSSPERIRHIPHILYHWRLIPGSTASGPDEKPYALAAGRRVVLEHLERQSQKVQDCEILPQHMMRVIRPLPDPAPTVTLIIPTRNLLSLLRVCVETVTTITDYPNFEVLILDNDSTDPETLNYLGELAQRPGVRVLKVSGPFNYSRLNNIGVASCESSVVGLLNNDIDVTHPGWLREMVSHAVRPDIGAVGAKLFFPNGSIQHAGVFLGVRGVAGHYYKHCPGDYLGIGVRAHVLQNVSAVTGACLIVERKKYLEVGGLDEEKLPVAFNDVDFCLKLLQAGYRNLFTPFARLVHHESASRGYSHQTVEAAARSRTEIHHFTEKWARFIENDPAYNPNLTILFETGTFAYPTRAPKAWKYQQVGPKFGSSGQH